MIVGNVFQAVVDYGRDEESVTGTPNSSVAIDEGLQTLVELLSADVEFADGIGVFRSYFEIALCVVALCDYEEGPSGEFDFFKTHIVRLAETDSAELIIVDIDVYCVHRFSCQEIRRCHPESVPGVGVFRYDADIR